MPQPTADVLPLTLAAARLGRSWAQAWRLVLIGHLCGEKRQGRWYVTAASVERLRRDTASAPLPRAPRSSAA